MWRSEFDPSETKILTDAFDVAWAYVAASPPSIFPEPVLAREVLALKIMALARAGEMDKLKLANFALGELRQMSQRRLSEIRVQTEIWHHPPAASAQADPAPSTTSSAASLSADPARI